MARAARVPIGGISVDHRATADAARSTIKLQPILCHEKTASDRHQRKWTGMRFRRGGTSKGIATLAWAVGKALLPDRQEAWREGVRRACNPAGTRREVAQAQASTPPSPGSIA